MDASEELALTEEAIAAVLKGGQSYSINTGGGGRTVTYANYAELVSRKRELEISLAAASGALGGRVSAGW